MAELSPGLAERARKNETTVLRALADASQVRVAEALGVSEATVSRFKDGGIQQAAALLAACGLKVVPDSMQCFAPDKVNALLVLARDHLAHIQQPSQLSWD